MKKIEYIAPEIESIEITEQSVLMSSVDSGAGGGWNPGPPPGMGGNSRSNDYEDED